MNVNDIIHGFKLIKTDHVPEVASDTFEFKHVKSGARLLYLKNNLNLHTFHGLFSFFKF